MKYYGYTSRHQGWATADAVERAVGRLSGASRGRFDAAYSVYRAITALKGHDVTHAWADAADNMHGLLADLVHDRKVREDAASTAQASYSAVEAELKTWERRIELLAAAGIEGHRSLTNGWNYLCVSGGDINLRADRPELTSGQYGMNHGERTPLDIPGW